MFLAILLYSCVFLFPARSVSTIRNQRYHIHANLSFAVLVAQILLLTSFQFSPGTVSAKKSDCVLYEAPPWSERHVQERVLPVRAPVLTHLSQKQHPATLGKDLCASKYCSLSIQPWMFAKLNEISTHQMQKSP